MKNLLFVRLLVRRSPTIRLSFIADCLHWLLVTLAIVECLRCKGRAFPLLLLTLLVPTTRLLCDRGYRTASVCRLRSYWQQLTDYAVPGSAIPWRAVFLLVVFPTFLLNISTDRFMGGRRHLAGAPNRVQHSGGRELGA